MSKVKGKDTRPEMWVRSLIHSLGYRYRLHVKNLPGVPDLAFPSRHKAIFVNGCFWHGHTCKRGMNLPQTNVEYWINKIEKNKERDIQNYRRLKQQVWQVLVIWECELKNKNKELLIQKIHNFLE